MYYRACSCGYRWWASSERSFAVQFCRCRQSHVRESVLTLNAKPLTLQNTLFFILTHPGQSLHRSCVSDLVRWGVPPTNVITKGGVSYNFKHGKRRLRGNERTHFSFRHKWFPRVSKELGKRRAGSVAGVVYCESNTSFETSNVHGLLQYINGYSSKDIFWLGYTRIRPSGYYGLRTQNAEIVQGSKCIVFRRRGLCRAWGAVTRTGRYGHLDFELSVYIRSAHLHVASRSMVGHRGHYSTSLGDLAWKPSAQVIFGRQRC